VPAFDRLKHLVEATSVTAAQPLNEVFCKFAKGDVERRFRLICIFDSEAVPTFFERRVRL
jgi:hypothetical protein